MAPRRWLLLALSVLSLFMLASASVGFLYSVPSGAPGERSVVVPIPDIDALPTGAQGAILAVGVPGGAFPSSASEVTLERALARVREGDNATVELQGVPMPNGTGNVTLDLAQLSGGRAGFVVKADEAETPRFVEESEVLGEYKGPTTTVWLVSLFLISLAGFLAPLIVMITTHKGAGQRGAGPIVCPECRTPLAQGAEFCTRCGAFLPGKEMR